MNIKEQATKNLFDIKGILDELNIIFWLDGGTLLGAYRDNDYPPGDEDDIDLGTWFNYEIFKPQIIEKANSIGLKLYHEWEHQLAFRRGGSKIDLFFHNKKGTNAWHCLYKQNNCIPAVVPAHYFEILSTIKFKDMLFKCPSNVEDYFEMKYGDDWRTPITREEYFKRGGCYDPNSNKVLQPNFDIN